MVFLEAAALIVGAYVPRALMGLLRVDPERVPLWADALPLLGVVLASGLVEKALG